VRLQVLGVLPLPPLSDGNREMIDLLQSNHDQEVMVIVTERRKEQVVDTLISHLPQLQVVY
jgi:hypothetical protein